MTAQERAVSQRAHLNALLTEANAVRDHQIGNDAATTEKLIDTATRAAAIQAALTALNTLYPEE